MFKPNADFLLRVSGMSMKDIGILDGDLLAVHKTQDVRNGQVVVARIDEEVTVKRLKKQGNVVELLPENSEFSPIVVDLRQQSFTIEGLAVGVIRNGEWLYASAQRHLLRDAATFFLNQVLKHAAQRCR